MCSQIEDVHGPKNPNHEKWFIILQSNICYLQWTFYNDYTVHENCSLSPLLVTHGESSSHGFECSDPWIRINWCAGAEKNLLD